MYNDSHRTFTQPLAEDLSLKKGQENLLITEEDKRKKEIKWKKELGWVLCPRERAVKEEKFPYPGASPQ